MKTALQNHPFAVEAFFTSSLVLTFAVPKEQLQAMLPSCLKIDTHHDKWGFVAVALVETKELRPKGFPKIFGRDFFLIGYRIFVRYTNNTGKNLRGLYILKSETNKKQMEILGTLFTKYRYSTVDIITAKANGNYYIQSAQSALSIHVDTIDPDPALPMDSPFSDWKEARRFAGPLPFTFSFNEIKKEVLIVEGVRQNWTPRPVRVIEYKIGHFNSPAFDRLQLANAFIVENIPYNWKKGKIEKWQE